MSALRDDDQPRVRHGGRDALGEGDGDGGIGLAVDDERRAVHAPEALRRIGPFELGFLGRDDSGDAVHADADHLLDDLVRVGLGEDVVHERLDEPAPIGSQLVEAGGIGWVGIRLELHVRRDGNDAIDALRLIGGEEDGGVQAARRDDDGRSFEGVGVHDRQRIGGMERERVAALRPVAGPRAPRVIGDDGGVRREGCDLVADDARVDEVPGRDEEDGAIRGAVSATRRSGTRRRSLPCPSHRAEGAGITMRWIGQAKKSVIRFVSSENAQRSVILPSRMCAISAVR